ncbi:SMI1/KNR4 family protein [Emticicia sp. C21]|uniref:SMI1/KNR4 family protein n=1 Tax=Emticicia sp. C21 TaxID=2302915 RepID=UPI000E34598D|nr:SMI1/KNR4 family protein [Emticicia sp. C21]RFS17852.1 hypothetical protein D0T08_00985 [Emticicia sp. C21]
MKPTINDITGIIERNKDVLDIQFNDGASMKIVNFFEQTINVSLPEDFVNFYLFCNGFTCENQIIFNFLSLQGIVKEWKLSKEIVLAEYMIFSETWYLRIDESDKNKYVIYTDGDIAVTNSLAEFLDKFLIGGVMGLSEWGRGVI